MMKQTKRQNFGQLQCAKVRQNHDEKNENVHENVTVQGDV